MGLDATVRCNCWERGLCTPTELAPLLAIDEEGYLGLRAPECDDDQLWYRVLAWQQTACAHPDMDFAHRLVSNWSGVSHFRHALHQAGAQTFPVLLRELPTANGGLVFPETARRMLEELRAFVALSDFGFGIALIDSATGETIQESPRDAPYFFSLSANDCLGIDETGFLIVRDEQVVFSSRRFEQQTLIPAGPNGSGQTLFRCLDSGASAIARIAVATVATGPDGELRRADGGVVFRHPIRLHVERRRISPADFDDVTDALIALCEAAIETGNPIRWC